jgi:hypothetical protein
MVLFEIEKKMSSLGWTVEGFERRNNHTYIQQSSLGKLLPPHTVQYVKAG